MINSTYEPKKTSGVAYSLDRIGSLGASSQSLQPSEQAISILFQAAAEKFDRIKHQQMRQIRSGVRVAAKLRTNAPSVDNTPAGADEIRQ